MNQNKFERPLILTVIVILAAALVAGAVMLVMHFAGSDNDKTTGESDRRTDTGTDEVTTPAAGNETDESTVSPPESDETTDPSQTGPSETDPPETTPAVTDPVTDAVTVTKYESPKTMYALSNVNARMSWTTNSDILYMVYESEAVKVTGETDNGWYVVEVRGHTAYIRSDLLTDDAAAVAVTITNYTQPKVMYAVSEVNIREDHTTGSKSFGTIMPGTEVSVLGETSNGWYQVSHNDGIAYIKSEYLSDKKPVVETEPTESRES